ncbi:hypothetical protein [Terrabacter terrigena]|uniref:Uncharacterized protein n=1 Tax=Terrabacter terrigena TaxID=574718 RepID=A0ABW3N129_9MICO
MPVSSLIFVVIVAIWAAYLVQHWARRREDAAATRSVDGFSEAMRVLEKRPSLPTTELSTPRPHSYAVKPARVAGPTVDVKRAVPAGTSRRHSPLVARRADPQVRATDLAETTPGRPGTDHDIAPYVTEVDRMHESARQSSSTGARRRPGSAPAPARVPLAQRRIRAALLLTALLWLPASIVLTVTGLLMWISIPFAVLTVGAVLVWLRAEAQADKLRTSTNEGREAHGRRLRDRRHDDYDWTATHVPVLSSEDTQVIRSSASAVAVGVEQMVTVQAAATGAAHAQPAAQAVAHSEPGVFDVQAPVAGEAPVARAEPEAAPEGSWSPVPVPRPTYALKAKAEPRFTEGGIPADVFDTPEFADEAEELDDRALFARRAVSQ